MATWYDAGSVAINNGSTTVTGTGTAFVDNRVQVGEGWLGPDGNIYEIGSVPSNTQLILADPYLGPNVAGGAYKVLPFRGRDTQIVAQISDLLGSFVSVRDGIGAGLMADGTVSAPGLRFLNDQDTGFRRVGSNHLAMVTGGVDRVNVNGTNVGIGTATPAQLLHVNGNALLGGSPAIQWSGVTAASDVAIQSAAPLLNFVNAAGDTRFGYLIHEGGTNGSIFLINQTASGSIAFATNNVTRWVMEPSGTFRPAVDGVQQLGTGSFRLGQIFSSVSMISTSDAREKKWIGAPGEAAVRAANRIIGELGFFQWSDAVEEKGEDGARIHFGVRAQEVVRVMIEEGLEAEQKLDFAPGKFIPAKSRPSFRHAFLCFDTWEDEYSEEVIEKDVPFLEPTGLLDEYEKPIMRTLTRKERISTGQMVLTRPAGNRFGLRIDQLTMFLLAALAKKVAQQQDEIGARAAEVSVLEARVMRLEAAK